ncbi:Fatty acid hydroxylase domain-containing protein [Tumidithrix helvetica PCC 7403]|uniref:sterol desaturase family protein n=1 Tax=Tumidithrix helvetica TaxID=3457545 RepID=UPI003C9202F3
MSYLIQFPVFVTFWGLMALTWANRVGRTQIKTKSGEEWLLDLAGLAIQGVLIPLLQITLLAQTYQWLLPSQSGCLIVSPLLSFLFSFAVVDYLYYWNHRLLHSATLWQIHQVHHTVTDLDVLGTSRNTLWSSILIVYLWVNALSIYLLADPTAYLLGVSLTSALDLWRHSRCTISPESWLYRYLSPWLILPQDHAWHHRSDAPNCNYGANLKLWDRWHRTYAEGTGSPSLGMKTDLTPIQKLLFPFP